MAKITAALKAARTAERKRLINQPVRSRVKTLLTQAESVIGSGDREAAAGAVKKAIAKLDGAGTKGVLHRNNIARRKSRLVKKYNKSLLAAPKQQAEEKKGK